MRTPAERVGELDRAGLARRLECGAGVDLASNDFLGIAGHPAVRDALLGALRDGVPHGATGSRLLSGHHAAFDTVEARFAAWQRRPAALFFSTGYGANLGLMSTLLEPGDIVVSDRLNHASLIDGIRLAKAQVRIVEHLDLAAYEAALSRAGRPCTVVVESVYSMDGDLAPLVELADLCARFSARLVVDEAHATGLFGADGAGRCSALPEASKPFASVHTCGKGLGLTGAFVCGSQALKELLINRARSFVYSTAPPPFLAVGLAAAIDLVIADPARRARPLALAERLRQALAGGLDTGASCSQIVPVILGSAERAVAVAERLEERGWDVRPIRPPTVAEGSSRLRLVLRADLDDEQVDRLAADLLAVAR
jgi:8-amino-7-oxononanoate synthase